MLPEQHRGAKNSYSVLDLFGRETQCFRGENGNFVPAGKLLREPSGNDTSAAAKGRVLVVTEQDAHVVATLASGHSSVQADSATTRMGARKLWALSHQFLGAILKRWDYKENRNGC